MTPSTRGRGPRAGNATSAGFQRGSEGRHIYTNLHRRVPQVPGGEVPRGEVPRGKFPGGKFPGRSSTGGVQGAVLHGGKFRARSSTGGSSRTVLHGGEVSGEVPTTYLYKPTQFTKGPWRRPGIYVTIYVSVGLWGERGERMYTSFKIVGYAWNHK